mgnify:CR=1 FL=1
MEAATLLDSILARVLADTMADFQTEFSRTTSDTDSQTPTSITSMCGLALRSFSTFFDFALSCSMATFDEQNVPGYFGIFSMPSVPHSLVETHSAKHPCVDRATLQVGFQIWIRFQQCIYSSKTIQVFQKARPIVDYSQAWCRPIGSTLATDRKSVV